MTPGSSNTFNSREMRRGVDVLQYNLYRDASRTVIWGNLSGGTSVYYDYGLANNRDTTVTVYGRIPAGQDVSAGAYSDTVTIEIWF
jgi:spore coat protein U-like protein